MNTRLCCWLLLALVAAGCSNDAPNPAGSRPPAPTANEAAGAGPAPAPAVTPPAAPAGPVAPAAAFTLDAKGAPVAALSNEAPVLVDVRTAAHEGFDRLVFEFDADGLPQWRAEWVEIPITDCGAGQVVPVSGTAWLQVRFSGAAAHTPEGKATSGPRQRRLRHPVLRDLARTCDFEGEVTWVAGLAGQHPFRADVLSAPPRLVIDIAH